MPVTELTSVPVSPAARTTVSHEHADVKFANRHVLRVVDPGDACHEGLKEQVRSGIDDAPSARDTPWRQDGAGGFATCRDGSGPIEAANVRRDTADG